MAFNREDLITWNELSTSLQDLLKAMQNSDTELGNKLAENIDKTNELDDRVTTLEEESGHHGDIIQKILKELGIIDRVGESSLLRAALELKVKLEFHKVDPNAHRFTIDNLIRTSSNNYYSAFSKVTIANLKEYLAIEAADQSITNSVTTTTSYNLGPTPDIKPVDYEALFRSVILDWYDKFVDTDRDTVIAALQSLYRDIYDHICDTDAHAFSSSVFTAHNVNFVFEKGYKVFLPSKTLAMVGMAGVTFPIPEFVPIDIDDLNQSEQFMYIERYLQQHLVSTDHGLNTLEPLFNVHKMGYDTLTLAFPVDQNYYNAKVIGRVNTAAGGVDGTGVVEGMSYSVWDKFICSAASEYEIPILVELKNNYATHTSMYSKVHPASDTNFLVHTAATTYPKSHIVHVPGMPANLALEALNAGTTSAFSPDFGVEYDLETEVKNLREEVNLLKANVQNETLSPTEIAAQATAIRQSLVNHIYGSASHVYNSPSCLTHTTEFNYKLGETVRATNINTNQKIEVIEAGKTDAVSPEEFDDPADIPTVEPATELNYDEYIQETIEMLNVHKSAIDAHYNSFAQYMIRRPSTEYAVGDTLWAKGMNSSHMLECIQAGTTASGELYVDIDTESPLQNLIQAHTNLMSHTNSNDSHLSSLTNGLMHHTNTFYSEGDIVSPPGLPTRLLLKATTSGMTSSERPNFVGRNPQVSTEAEELDNKLNELRSLVDPTTDKLVEETTEVAQCYANHKVYPGAHYYNSANVLTHTPNTRYQVGDLVYSPKINRDMYLECIQPGITNIIPPSDISDPYPDPETVTPATEQNYQKYALELQNTLNKHDSDKKAHAEAFSNSVVRLPSTHYDAGDIVVYDSRFKLECVNSGVTSPEKDIIK